MPTCRLAGYAIYVRGKNVFHYLPFLFIINISNFFIWVVLLYRLSLFYSGLVSQNPQS